MDFEASERARDLRARLQDFMDEHVYPAEPVYEAQIVEAGDPHAQPAVMEELKAEARERRPVEPLPPRPRAWGAGLTNLEYAPLAEIMGRSAHRAGGVQLHRAGHRATWRSSPSSAPPSRRTAGCGRCSTARSAPAFAMTEPDVASSDATNIAHADRARRRRVRPQRAQVVDDERAAPELPDPHRHGQDGPRRARRTGSRAWCSCRSTRPGVTIDARPAGVRLPRPGGPRRAAASRTSACRRRTSSPARATAS